MPSASELQRLEEERAADLDHVETDQFMRQPVAPEMLEVSPINAFAQRFTAELDDYVRGQLPMTMSDEEYGRATAAMLISLNRTLATCCVAFAKTHGVERNFVTKAQLKAFLENLDAAYDAAAQGEGTIQ